MKFSILIVGVLIAMMVSLVAVADNHRQQFVQTQIAIPVGIPVAPYAPYYFSSSQQQQQAYSKAPSTQAQLIAKEVAPYLIEELRKQGVGTFKALEKPTVFGVSCAACHGKERLKESQPRFTTLANLSDGLLDECEDALLFDRMPLGGHLAPDKNGELLKEFNGERKRRREANRADVAPPMQSEPKAHVEAADSLPPPPPSPSEQRE